MTQLPTIIWQNEYATNIPVIDSQHRKLFEIYNEMAAHINDHGINGVNALITELIRYTREHFTYEEKLMQKFAYSGCAEHMEEHNDFIEKLMELVHGNSEGKGREEYLVFAEFLADWLVNHIMVVDSGYVDTIMNH